MKQRFLAIGVCAAVFSVSGTNLGAPSPIFLQGRLATPPDSSTAAALKALVNSPGSRLVEIRSLATVVDPSAQARLLEIFEESQERPDPLVELELVRALSSHMSGPRRDAVVRALLASFERRRIDIREPRSSESEGSGGLTESQTGSLLSFARGSAALALARAEHPEAARVLVLTATASLQEDPEGAQLAREALAAFPLSAATKNALGALVDAHALKKLSEPVPLPEFLVESPMELHHLAEAAPDSVEPLTESPGNEGALSTWRDVVYALATRKTWPDAFLEPDGWKKASELDGPWTLRALALLTPHQPQLKNLAEQAAKESLKSRDDNRRGAAAFLLAVLSPKDAAAYLKSKDEVIRNAVLSQSYQGILAEAAYSHARSLSKPSVRAGSKSPAFAIPAFRTSLHESSTWKHWSTRSLWEVGAKSQFVEWASPLASRMISARGEGAPSVSQVTRWLNDPSPQLRAAVIAGLARNDSPSARGLLLSTYRTETDVAVRRGICRAFWVQQIQSEMAIEKLIRLDPDRGCRSLAQGRPDPGAREIRVLRATTTPVEITDRVGSTHLVFAAPDGFVGLVGADL